MFYRKRSRRNEFVGCPYCAKTREIPNIGMEPGVLIFLLYLMIAHELVCGLMQYRRQADKPHKRLMWHSSAPVCPGTRRVIIQPVHTRRREKYGRIVRKV